MLSQTIQLSRHENQARGIGQYAIDFLAGRLGRPDEAVLQRVEQFHLDSVACAVAALATDPQAARWSGGVLVAATLARIYGFTDVDGRLPRPLTLSEA